MSLEDETRTLLVETLKTRGQQARIAEALEVSATTVMRWKEGEGIPAPMVKLLRLYLLGEIPFEMVHPRQDLSSVLRFTAEEWKVIETLALRGGVTAAEWIAGQVRGYLSFLEETATRTRYPSAKDEAAARRASLKVAEEAEAKRRTGA